MPLTMASSIGRDLSGQTVLVLQGGGALGAYQAGVYEALHEAGIEPDWVIGTSIGAINGAIIAGNEPGERMPRLRAFWDRMRLSPALEMPLLGSAMGHWLANLSTLSIGIPAFFSPRAPWASLYAPVGVYAASWYTTEPLHETLAPLIDFKVLNAKRTRLTVGAVGVRSGEIRYFDSLRDKEPLALEHVMASGALPPAFPAVRVADEAYWDGGIYSNSPVEAVLNDNPRRDSVIFSVNVWQPAGPEPQSIWEVLGRQKNIQYASRAESHIAGHKQLHRMRHVVRELARHLPDSERGRPEFRNLAGHGCSTTMHVVRFLAPELDGDDYTKDIDFTSSGVRERWDAGKADARRMLERAPWRSPVDPLEGVVIHQDAPMSERLAQS